MTHSCQKLKSNIVFQDIFKNSKFWAKFDLLTALLAIKQILDKATSMPVLSLFSVLASCKKCKKFKIAMSIAISENLNLGAKFELLNP